ncbi:MAG: serine/threonine protein kinase [Cognaticolwellia sp.]|jgi:serine/threonine protein kinase
MDPTTGSVVPGTTSHDPLLGRVLDGRFQLVELLAKGGMGRVYKGIQSPLGREVAVKVLDLSDSVEDDGHFRSRFFREASVCAKLTHPNTVRVFDYGQDGETYFLVMELLEGRTLHRMVKDEGPLNPLRVVRIVRQISRSLYQAHQQGVIHRDLKPANIFVCNHGDEDGDEEFVKVLDFGLVKPMDAGTQVTRAGNILGSPAYMSPEQVMGKPVSPASDVYSLAACMFVLLTREMPFRRDHPMAVLNAQINAPPPTLRETLPTAEFPDSLEWVMARALEKEPELRFSSMRQLDRALRMVERELRGQGEAAPMSLVEGVLVSADLEDSTELRPDRPFVRKSNPINTAPTRAINPEPVNSQATLALSEPVQQDRSAVGQFAMGLGVAGAAVLVVSVLTAVAVYFFVMPEGGMPVVGPVAVEVGIPVVVPDALPDALPVQDPDVPAPVPQASPAPAQVKPAASRPKTAPSPAADLVPDKPSVSPESAPTAKPLIQEPEPQQAAPETQNKPRELRDPWETP